MLASVGVDVEPLAGEVTRSIHNEHGHVAEPSCDEVRRPATEEVGVAAEHATLLQRVEDRTVARDDQSRVVADLAQRSRQRTRNVGESTRLHPRRNLADDVKNARLHAVSASSMA